MKSLDLISDKEAMPQLDPGLAKMIEQENFMDQSMELIDELSDPYLMDQ